MAKAKKRSFKPEPGQIDYTHARWAPVINCVLRHKNKILLVQRSKELHHYAGYWNGVSGFLDDQKSLVEKVAGEIREETGIPKNKIGKIRTGEIFDQDEPRHKKTWIVHPILVEVKTDKVELDWEGQQYRWVSPWEIKKFKLMPGFDQVLEYLAAWL